MVERDRLFSPRQAAERLGLHPITIYRLIWAGRLPAKRLPGGGLRIEAEELERLLEGNKKGTKPCKKSKL